MRKLLLPSITSVALVFYGCATPQPAQAQSTSATVVTACGTPPATYPVGANRSITQDTTGTLCTVAGGGGGGGNVNLTGINGVAPTVNTGATAAGSLRVTTAQDTATIAGSAPGTAGTPSTNVVSVQGVSGGTPAPVSAASGSFVAGAISDGADVAEGATSASAYAGSGNTTVVGALKGLYAAATAAIPAGTATIGGTVPRADTTSGVTAYGLQTAASTNSTLVSTGAHTLYGINLESTSTTVMYLRVYDSAGAPTCSSSTGFSRTWAIPPASSSGLVGGIAVHLPIQGVKFTSGLAFCVTGGATSTDNTNATTGGFVNLDYQ